MKLNQSSTNYTPLNFSSDLLERSIGGTTHNAGGMSLLEGTDFAPSDDLARLRKATSGPKVELENSTGGGFFSDTFNRESMFGQSGWFSPMVQGAGAIMQGWAAVQQNRNARKMIRENKRQFNLNFNQQAAAMEDRIRSRHDYRERREINRYASADEAVSASGIRRI